MLFLFFFFNDTATTEIYTLSLHDALPIWLVTGSARGRRPVLPPRDGARRDAARAGGLRARTARRAPRAHRVAEPRDRKSTRLNSSHANISYAVFCLKKKKNL